MISRERPGLMASRFMAEWRNMTGEDSATQDMLLAMWAHPSPNNINENTFIQDLIMALGESGPAIKAQVFRSSILKFYELLETVLKEDLFTAWSDLNPAPKYCTDSKPDLNKAI